MLRDKKKFKFSTLDAIEKMALFVILGVVFFGIVLSVGLNYLQSVKPKRAQINQVSDFILHSYSGIIEHHIDSVQSSLNHFIKTAAVQKAVQTGSLSTLNNEFSNFKLEDAKIIATRVYDTTPSKLYNKGLDSVGYGAINQIERALHGEHLAPEVHLVNKKLYLNLVAPLKNKNTQSFAVLVSISPKWLDQVLNSIKNAPGRVNLEQVSSNGKHLLLASSDGVKIKRADFSLKLPNANWQLTMRVKSELFAHSFRNFKIFMFIVMCLSLMAAFCTWGFKRALRLIERDVAQVKNLMLNENASKAKNYRFASKVIQKLYTVNNSINVQDPLSKQPLTLPNMNGNAQDYSNAQDDSNAKQSPNPSYHNREKLDLPNPVFQKKGNIQVSEIENSTDETATMIPQEIFRAYDIRGIVGKHLNANTMQCIAQSVAKLVIEAGHKQFVIARDSRESSEAFSTAFIDGLRKSGIDVIDIGMCSSPILYFAVSFLGINNGAVITGSHNPKAYNGVKLVINNEAPKANTIQEIYKLCNAGEFDLSQQQGTITQKEVTWDYISKLQKQFKFSKRLKVVVDSGNAVMGPIVSQYMQQFNLEMVPLFCDVDSNFPNHHPDPSVADNLQALSQKVKDTNADLGIAFDGDGDRLGVVDNKGNIVWPDRLLLLYAAHILPKASNRTVIYDVKCSKILQSEIESLGGIPHMFKTGHTLIKHEIKATNAILAGEMSGHIFFNDRYDGVDDAFYAALRLCEVLDANTKTLYELTAAYPRTYATNEIRVAVPNKDKFELVEKFKTGHSLLGAKLVDIDGIRVEYSDCWGLIRASNTTPDLVFRFEADTEAALKRVQGFFKNEMERLLPDTFFGFE